MAKKEPTVYRAKVTNDAGIFRGKIPSPLIRELGGRPGDYMVFHYDGVSRVAMSVSHTKGSGKAAAKSPKGRAVRTGKKR